MLLTRSSHSTLSPSKIFVANEAEVAAMAQLEDYKAAVKEQIETLFAYSQEF
jgi:hypothetical protein